MIAWSSRFESTGWPMRLIEALYNYIMEHTHIIYARWPVTVTVVTFFCLIDKFFSKANLVNVLLVTS